MAQSAVLYVHFDVNKTVIVRDPVSGVTLEAMSNAVVSECVYGRGDAATGAWTPETGVVLDRAPHEAAGLVTYAAWLEEHLKVERMERKRRKAAFTDPGEPGEASRGEYERLLSALRLPEGQRAAMAAQNPKLWSSGYHFLLPSFLEVVKALDAAGRDFVVVFRTFGIDTLEVAAEWNALCSGEHPLHPGVRMDGSGGSVDRRLQFPHASGTIMRLNEDDEGVCLAMPGPTNLVKISQGARGFVDALREKRAQGCRAIGIHDNYDFWARHGESDTSGKLLVQDPATAASELHVLFDDNVEFNRAHIVDVRTESGDPVPFEASAGRFLIKSEPFEAITDTQYFVRMLQEAEAAAVAGAGAAGAAAAPEPPAAKRARA